MNGNATEPVAGERRAPWQARRAGKKYDAQLGVVFDAIREPMTPPQTTKKPIGSAG